MYEHDAEEPFGRVGEGVKGSGKAMLVWVEFRKSGVLNRERFKLLEDPTFHWRKRPYVVYFETEGWIAYRKAGRSKFIVRKVMGKVDVDESLKDFLHKYLQSMGVIVQAITSKRDACGNYHYRFY